jgi:hypothetical protein
MQLVSSKMQHTAERFAPVNFTLRSQRNDPEVGYKVTDRPLGDSAEAVEQVVTFVLLRANLTAGPRFLRYSARGLRAGS